MDSLNGLLSGAFQASTFVCEVTGRMRAIVGVYATVTEPHWRLHLWHLGCSIEGRRRPCGSYGNQ